MFAMSANEDIRKLLLRENLTLKQLSELTVKTGKAYTADSLSKKLRQNTLKYTEAKYLAGVMHYEIEFKKVPLS
jgi:hypothetical protein